MKTFAILGWIFFVFTSFLVQAQNYQISAPDDDAEESAGFTVVSLNSPVIDLTSDPTNQKNMKQFIGLRFNNISLERGTPLSNCYLAFHVDQPCAKVSMLAITGEKSVNAQSFQAVNRNISSRVKTTAKVNWNNVQPWNEAGQFMNSPDISNILMEIIGQNDWKPGNAIVLMIEGNGMRHATSYDKNPELAIQLVLNDPSGARYKKPVVTQIVQQTSTPQPQQLTPHEPVATDECNIPEPPLGVAKQAYQQGNLYMEKEDFTSAEARYSMALDNLKHPKFYICRAAARQLLSKTKEAQSDLNQAISMGINAQMAQKCFSDMVNQYKNFGAPVGNMFPFCFTENVRGFTIPPCPMNISIDGEMATWIAQTKYEVVSKNTPGTYAGYEYNSIKTSYDWKITPGNFHPCNPNIATKFKISDNYRPTKKDEVYTANTAGWFEIPVKLDYVDMYLDAQGKLIKSHQSNEDWVFVGWLIKLHTGETTVTGRLVGANGKGFSGLKVN